DDHTHMIETQHAHPFHSLDGAVGWGRCPWCRPGIGACGAPLVGAQRRHGALRRTPTGVRRPGAMVNSGPPDRFGLALGREPPGDLARLIEDETSTRGPPLRQRARIRAGIGTGSSWRTVQPVTRARRLTTWRRSTSPWSATP